jgi:chloramphenicol O-acetyltransferase type B
LYYLAKLIKKLHFTAIKSSDIHQTAKIEADSEVYSSSMGKHSFCGYRCSIAHCDIGSFCSIANNVTIGGGMHPMEWISTSPAFYEGRDSIKAKFSTHSRKPPLRVTIGHDVWIGERVLIKQGVKVGTGAVIGMGSVVTKDVLPYSIVSGVPAIEIRKRFKDDKLIERLLASEWWTLPERLLHEKGKYAKDPELFLREIER